MRVEHSHVQFSSISGYWYVLTWYPSLRNLADCICRCFGMYRDLEVNKHWLRKIATALGQIA